MMKSREFKKVYHPSLGRYVYEHRGNGLVVDNIIKPLTAGLSAAVKQGAKAVVRKFTKGAKDKAKAKIAEIQEKSGDIIRQRLSDATSSMGKSSSKGKSTKGKSTKVKNTKGEVKMTQRDVNRLINNLISMA